ncbi:hypothetical protein M5689_018793 [Euphorbia peplus]|nr:hypothetical protein M5689_018793 [Euphorbia peplus]
MISPKASNQTQSPILQGRASERESEVDEAEKERAKQLLGPEDLAIIEEGYRQYVGYLKTLTKADSLIDVPIGKFLADMCMIPGEFDLLSEFC